MKAHDLHLDLKLTWRSNILHKRQYLVLKSNELGMKLIKLKGFLEKIKIITSERICNLQNYFKPSLDLWFTALG